jgi:4-carboxymuconolactone decarboxylase
MRPRLAGLRKSDLSPEQLEVYEAIAGGPRAGGPFPLTDDQGCLRGPFNAMLLSPPLGLALQALGAAVRYRSGLTDRARELAILVVAAHWNSAFELEAHEAVGRRCGLTDADFEVIRAGGLPDVTEAAERAAAATARILATAGRLTDEQYRAAVDALGERGLFDLTTLVGYYTTLALQLRVFAGEGAA